MKKRDSGSLHHCTGKIYYKAKNIIESLLYCNLRETDLFIVIYKVAMRKMDKLFRINMRETQRRNKLNAKRQHIRYVT